MSLKSKFLSVRCTVAALLAEAALLLPPAASADIVINEVMAKNEATLATMNGTQGIDWVELYNSGDEEVDITGWYLFNKPKKSPDEWTQIQGECRIPAKGYRIVWCDGDGICTSWDASEPHVACNISTDAGKHTVFIASAADKEAIVHRVEMPQSHADISYGFGHLPNMMLDEGAPAQYKVGSGAWKQVSGPIGMSASAGVLKTVAYNLNYYGDLRINNLEDAERYAADSNYWRTDVAKPVADGTVASFALRLKGVSRGDFADYNDIPGFSKASMVCRVTGAVKIPESGEWTFSTGCFGGFVVRLKRLGVVWSLGDTDSVPSGYARTLDTLDLEAGVYEIEVVWFKDSRDGLYYVLDLSAAKGRHESFSTDVFKVIGESGSAIEVASPLGAQIANDIGGEMLGVSRTLSWKSTFSVEDPSAAGTPKLRMRYSDPFVAKFNGTQVASVGDVGSRTAEEMAKVVEFPIDAALVRAENTLEVTMTNNSADDSELLLSAGVASQEDKLVGLYFEEPTPGAANSDSGRTTYTPEVLFSERHGYKTEPFQLVLSCAGEENSERKIYYTTDGTRPDPSSSTTRLYTSPIAIDRTTCVRACACDANSLFETQWSATYLFLSDILRQDSSVPAGFPADKEVNGQYMTYGLDKAILADSKMLSRFTKSFTNGIRTVSIVMDPKDLFDGTRGIYCHAQNRGRDWERPTMLEQIHPGDQEDEFTAICGIRIRGAYSRNANYRKHSFHMIFRGEYGMDRLEHPLFGDEGAESFKRIDFRTEQNNAWVNYDAHSRKETMVNEVFSRDSQRDMGQPYNRSNYYHLFINGIYWGVYQTEERVEKNYAADYLGGDDDNYDVIRTTSMNGGNYHNEVADGNEDAWSLLHSITLEGYGADHPGNYNRVRGLNPDGTRNFDYPILLDVTNLVCYLLTSQWGADGDSPANGHNTVNNVIAYRNRVEGDSTSEGFKFNRHDAENSMSSRKLTDGYTSGAHYLTYGKITPGTSTADLKNFNPTALHVALMENAEYRRTFQDIVQKQFFSADGAMTVEACEARYRARMAEIEDAVVAELARWGDGRFGYSTWESACNSDLEFIEKRLPYLMSNYRSLKWFPKTDAPTILDSLAEMLRSGTYVGGNGRVYLNGGDQGKIYYTTDGSDPWLANGSRNPAAIEFTGSAPGKTKVKIVSTGDVWRYFEGDAAPDGEWTSAGYNDSLWKEGRSSFGFVNTASSDRTFATQLSRYQSNGTSNIKAFFFRRKFTLPAEANAESLTKLFVDIDCDDGYIAYINGVEVKRENVDTAGYTFSGNGQTNIDLPSPATRWEFSAGLLKTGENTLAVELHQCHGNSSDAWWNLEASYESASGQSEGGIAVPVGGMVLKARVYNSSRGEWSALSEVSLLGAYGGGGSLNQDQLRFYEIYGSTKTNATEATGDVGEYIVLTNISAKTVGLVGLKVNVEKLKDWNKSGEEASKCLFVLTSGSVAPYGSVRLDQDVYWGGDPVNKKITNGDVYVCLTDCAGSVVQCGEAAFDGVLYPGVDMEGAALRAVSFEREMTNDADHWCSSEGSSVPPAPVWDVAGKSGGIAGFSDGHGGKRVSFRSISLKDGKIAVEFAAGRVDADGQKFALVCKRRLTDVETFTVTVTLSDDRSGNATIGALEGATDEPSLFILGIGPAAAE